MHVVEWVEERGRKRTLKFIPRANRVIYRVPGKVLDNYIKAFWEKTSEKLTSFVDHLSARDKIVTTINSLLLARFHCTMLTRWSLFNQTGNFLLFPHPRQKHFAAAVCSHTKVFRWRSMYPSIGFVLRIAQ